ncbi:hypothetical protein YC2023_053094 [Brassica napus]
MSSSQLPIFCIIMIALFPLHEFVHGQGLNAGNAAKQTCKQMNCDTQDKNRSCSCCVTKSGKPLWCHKSKDEFVHGQGLNAGNAAKQTCKQMNCDTQDKNRSCSCCVTKSGEPLWCHKSKDECTLRCTKPLNSRT